MNKEKLIRIIYPSKCPLCGNIVPLDRDYCSCYKETVRKAENLCERCGIRKDRCLCGEEGIITLPHFTAPFYYDGLIRAKLHNLKFNGRRFEASDFAPHMAKSFASAFPSAKVDVVTFVPMTVGSEKKRGFNQSRLFAEKTAKKLGLPCAALLLKKEETETQHSLNRKNRMKNLTNCFETENEALVKGKKVLLVDDIKTTGKTLHECCKALLSAGAEDVFCLSAAVTEFPPESDEELFL